MSPNRVSASSFFSFKRSAMVTLYILSGVCLVVAFAIVIVYYFSPKRKDDVEAAKYEMLNDSDEPIIDDPEAESSKK